jgi:hypothetical protein
MESIKSPRKIILHAHIFKNAGTSVDNILRHNYAKQFIDHRDSDDLAQGKQQYLNDFFSQNPQISAFASHHLPLPLQASAEYDYYIIMMLRHPIIRASSAYRFERRQLINNRSANAAKRYCFADYVRWHMDRGSHMFLNYFIRYCTSAIQPPITDELRLKYALEASEHFSVLGIVERFSESMTVLQQKLATQGLDLQVISSKKNVTDKSSDGIEGKLARIQKQLGEPLYAAMFEQNKQDLLFYEHAVNRLNSEIS